MHSRALSLALEALSLACVAAALGSSGCYTFCDQPFRDPARDIGSDIEPIFVGGGPFRWHHVVVGQAGEIVITTPDGERIETRVPIEVRLHAVAGDRWLVAVGEGGAIVVSEDGGETWLPRTSGTTHDLRVIMDTKSGSHGWIAAGDDVVLVSNDTETWTIVDEPEGGWGALRAGFASESRIWLVGDRGVAWSSHPAVGTWVSESLGTSDDLLGISASRHARRDDISIAASKTKLFMRAPGDTEWRQITPPFEGEILGLSGGFVLTSKGKVFSLDEDGHLKRVPIDIDFTPTAIRGEPEFVVVIGQGGRFAQTEYRVCKGRPLLDVGTWVVAPAIERDDWLAGELESNEALDEREASRWLRAGLDEHASSASFAVHVLELISLGAPAELVLAAQQAMADEVRHAALSFGLARRYSGPAQGPGRLPIRPASLTRLGDARAIALALFEGGCVGETLAACEADVDARTCTDEAARAVLQVIAGDERRHAVLAWSTLRWLIERDASLREPLLQRLHELALVTRPEIHTATMRELIIPLAMRLLDRSARECRDE